MIMALIIAIGLVNLLVALCMYGRTVDQSETIQRLRDVYQSALEISEMRRKEIQRLREELGWLRRKERAKDPGKHEGNSAHCGSRRTEDCKSVSGCCGADKGCGKH